MSALEVTLIPAGGSHDPEKKQGTGDCRGDAKALQVPVDHRVDPVLDDTLFKGGLDGADTLFIPVPDPEKEVIVPVV